MEAKKAESMGRMMADLAVDRKDNPSAFTRDQWSAEEGEDDEDGDGDDNDIIDRSTCLTSTPCICLFTHVIVLKTRSVVKALGKGNTSILRRWAAERAARGGLGLVEAVR